MTDPGRMLKVPAAEFCLLDIERAGDQRCCQLSDECSPSTLGLGQINACDGYCSQAQT